MSEEKLPKGWRKSKLSEVVEILDNLRVPVSSSEREKRIGNIPYYGATGQTGWIDDFIFDEELVLLGEDGAPFFDKKKNVAYIVNGKSWVNNHAHVLRALTLITSNKFVLYFLNHFDYTGFVGGTTRLKLTQGSLKIIPIPLPPLPEQQRIVAKLDAAFGHLDSLREKLDRIPELLKNFRQQVLTQAVTGELTREWRERKDLGEWEEKRLNEISLSVTDGDHQAPPKAEIGIPFLVISDISNGKLDLEKATRFVPIEYFKNLKEARKPKKHDILYTVTGSIGIPVLLEDEFEFTFQRHIGIIRPNRNLINEKYLFYSLKSEYCLAQGRNVATGTAQLTIPLGGLRNYNIPLPTYSEQNEIVKRVDALFGLADKIESQYQSLKANIESLPQAILAKAFRGELVGQEVKEYVREVWELGMVAEGIEDYNKLN